MFGVWCVTHVTSMDVLAIDSIVSCVTHAHHAHHHSFIMMCPQLYLNYRLKSVAHLPWRMLTYKALVRSIT